MSRLLSAIDAISDWSGKAVGILIVPMTVILAAEVISRYAFDAPSSWAHELTLHLFGAYSVLVGAYVLRHSQHVRVDIVYSKLSPRGRAILDSITYPVFFSFIGLLMVSGTKIALHAIEIAEISPSPWGSPMYPIKLTIPVAASLMILQGLAHFIRALAMAITGRELA